MTMAWCVVCQGVVCNTVTLANFHRSLWVMRSRSWCMAMHWRCRMVHSGLRHVTVSIEVSRLVIVATSVGHEQIRMIKYT